MRDKKRFKLIKTKHTWLRVALTTSVVAGGFAFSGNSVLADTNNAQPVNGDSNQNNKETTNPESSVSDSKSAVEKAQDNSNAVQTNLDQAQKKVANDQSNVENQTGVVNSAQANKDKYQKISDEATPENISSTKKNIASTNQDLEANNKAIDTATNDANSANQTLKNSENVQQESKNDLEKDQNNVNGLENKKTQVSNDINQTNKDITAQSNDINNDKNAISQNNKELSKTNDQIANLENQKTDKEAQYKDALKVVDQAQNTVNDKNDALSQAKNAQSSQQGTVNSNEDVLHNLIAQKEAQFGSTIKVPAGMTLDNYKKAVQDGTQYTWWNQFSQEGLKTNVYVDNEKAKQENIDVTKLTDSQYNELQVYAGNLINSIHEQFGTPTVKVGGDGMNNFVKGVLQNYQKDGWSIFIKRDHDVDGIVKSAGENGLISDQGNLYENAATGNKYIQASNITMNDLYKGVYLSVVDFIFNDAQSLWGHASSISGANLFTGDSTNAKYLGVGIELSKDGNFQIHYLLVSDDTIKDPSKFDQSQAYSPSSEEIDNKIANATTVLNASKDALNKATEKVNNATNELNQANDNLKNKQADADALNPAKIQENLNKLHAKATELSNLITTTTNGLGAKETNLTNLQNKLQTLNNDLQKVNAELVTANTKLDSAKADYQAKTDKVNADKAVRDAKQATLDKAIADKTSTEKKLADLKETLNLYTNASSNLETAIKELATATTKLAELKETLATDQKAVSEYQAKFDLAQKDLDKAKANLETAIKRQQIKESVEKAEKEQREQSNKNTADAYNQKQSTNDGNGTSVNENRNNATNENHVENGVVWANGVAGKHFAKDVNGKSLKATSKDKAINSGNNTKLPQTGETQNQLVILIGALLSGLGALGLGYKRKEN